MATKIKLYLSARISKDAHNWNVKVCNSLKSPISIFMPQKNNPWNLQHTDFPKEVYELDLGAMKESDACLLLPPYGRDCAWEIGWYSNSDKPIIAFVEKEIEWLRDWMVKGGVNCVITTDSQTWNIFKKDPILRHKKIVFINSLNLLSDKIISFLKEWRSKNG